MRDQFEEIYRQEYAKVKAEFDARRDFDEITKAQPGDLFGGVLFGSDVPQKSRREYLTAATGWVYSCVSAIADAISSVEFKLNRMLPDGTVEEVMNHPLLELLYKVNPVQTKYDFWNLATYYLELLGEAPIYAVRANENAPPSALMLLLPDRFAPALSGSVDPANFMPYNHFEYQVDSGKKIQFELWETLFIKYPDPARPYRGIGTLSAAARTVDIDNFAEDFNKNFFYNSARPDSMLTTEKALNKKQREDLRRMVKQVYGGKKNAHKTMILEHGFDFKYLNLTQKEMDYLETMKFDRDKICSIFRVPKSVVAITEDVNLANAKVGMSVFIEFTVKPKLKRIVEQLNEFLVPMFPDAAQKGLYLSFVAPEVEDLDAKLKRYESGLKLGWLTPNEVRFDEDLESLGPEGDVPIPLMVNPSLPVEDMMKLSLIHI